MTSDRGEYWYLALIIFSSIVLGVAIGMAIGRYTERRYDTCPTCHGAGRVPRAVKEER
jgi:uncharacterized membrane-anchored protein YhcB (DUF1043 family)